VAALNSSKLRTPSRSHMESPYGINTTFSGEGRRDYKSLKSTLGRDNQNLRDIPEIPQTPKTSDQYFESSRKSNKLRSLFKKKYASEHKGERRQRAPYSENKDKSVRFSRSLIQDERRQESTRRPNNERQHSYGFQKSSSQFNYEKFDVDYVRHHIDSLAGNAEKTALRLGDLLQRSSINSIQKTSLLVL